MWPTGEFSYGSYSERPDDRLDSRPVEWCSPGDEGGDASPPLDSTNVSNSHIAPQCLLSAGSDGLKADKPKAVKYGKKGITGYGKKMLKSAGLLLHQRPERYRLTFATVTLPELPSETRKAVALDWGRLVNRLNQWLCRRLERQSLPKAVLSVTEVQPKRLERTGQAYLHLHLVWPNHRSRRAGWAVDPNEIRTWLIRYLKTHHNTGDIPYISIDTQQVKGNAAGYIAKYLSKGQEEIKAVVKDLGVEALPGQWWNMTKLLKEWVWAALQSGPEVAQRLSEWVNWAFDYDNFELFRYLYHVEIDIGGFRPTVGWRGCLSAEAMGIWEPVSSKRSASPVC